MSQEAEIRQRYQLMVDRCRREIADCESRFHLHADAAMGWVDWHKEIELIEAERDKILDLAKRSLSESRESGFHPRNKPELADLDEA